MGCGTSGVLLSMRMTSSDAGYLGGTFRGGDGI